ncbi:MAG: hypothetical protein GWN61_22585, partial [candidate division Zixibacteria bacterium]|nr:hypothetical protein [Phycisphaerae bacterium]NIR67265.1 hypothetical protein [candidate division Zixibacteria bacterium]NIW49364.1 hypothetical protein [Gammaproteobacteria bacterium]NIU16716.1 hypothetical protein [candidate division Zixibacteria bacterium]NIV08884.1 hypothetical protein [candidate division Zixibacteria bacterium]
KYDNTVAGLTDGAMVWYDDDEIQYVVSVPADNFGSGPTDDYCIVYDAINDEHYYTSCAGVGGSTDWDSIEDPDA